MIRLFLALALALIFAAHARAENTAPLAPGAAKDSTLNAILGGVTGPTPPGSAVIGTVGVDQTTPGRSNAVQLNDNSFLYGSCSSNCLYAAILGPVDTTGYQSIQTTGLSTTGAGGVVWQGSNDPVCSTATNWFGGNTGIYETPALNDKTSVNVSAPAFASGTVPVVAHCMRLEVVSYTSGSFAAEAVMRPWPVTMAISSPVSVIATPNAGVQVTNSATATTGAFSATLAAMPGYYNYVCGFTVSSGGTTSAAPVTITVTGGTGGTLSYIYVPATGGASLPINFSPCVVASATNIAIAVNIPALGAGTVAAANIRGFYSK
jgi:hypothetical protein